MNDLYIQTPLLESIPLSKEVGIPVYLKMEALQPSGSYKDRGLGILLSDALSQGFNSFVTASFGNAGLSLAQCCITLNCQLTVIVPEKTPNLIIDKMTLAGADVIVKGKTLENAEAVAQEIALKENIKYINPHDNLLIFEGISTMIYEVFGAGVKPGAILLSVGCGELLVGIIKGLHACKWNDVPLITAETESHCPYATALFAEENQAKSIVPEAFISHTHPVHPHIVTDKAAFDAAVRFANDHRVLVEPGSAAALALVYQNLPLLKTFSSVLVIVNGGSNVNLSTFTTP